MATTFVLADCVSDAANLTNSPAFSTQTRVTLAQATAWAAQSARSLCALLRQKFPEDREFLQYAALATIPSLPLVSLPPDTGEVHSVVWVRGTDDSVLLPSAGIDSLTKQPFATDVGWSDESVVPAWRLEGQTIALYPASGKAETLEVFYTTHISPTSGTFQGRIDFDRWVTLDVAIKVSTAKKKFADVQAYQQQKALLENDLLALSRSRDVNKTHAIRDVRSRSYGRMRRGWGY